MKQTLKRASAIALVIAMLIALFPTTFAYSQVGNGSSGQDVKTMQTMLNMVMNAGLSVDGICGPKSVAAIKSFQSAYGLSADGICGKNTWAKLEEAYNNINKRCTSHSKGSYLWSETAHPHYQYYKCANCGETFTDGSTTSVSSCSTCNPPTSSNSSNSSRTTIRNGSQGTDVKTMQTMLNAVMNAGLSVDGICGTKSVAAIKNFQSVYGLVADGICGKNTWAKLEEAYNSPRKCTSHSKGTYLWPETAHPHYQYYKCANCGETFTDGSTTSMSLCSTCNPPKKEETQAQQPTTSRTTIRNGSQGADVKTMQTMLNAVMNAGLSVDGICGTKSVAAIRNFQKANGLSADGVCGKNTWSKLEEAYNTQTKKQENCKKHKYNSANGDICLNCGYIFQPKLKSVNKVYYTVKNNVVLRDNYYASGNKKHTIAEEGTPIRITHSLTNAVNNTWYKTSDGYYVYSERLTDKSGAFYSVLYDANGGNNAPAAQAKEKNKAIKLSIQIPTRSGYVFVGWDKSKDATTTSYNPGGSLTSSEDVKLYAIWKKSKADDFANFAAGFVGLTRKELAQKGLDIDVQGVNWCAYFVSACAKKLSLSEIIPYRAALSYNDIKEAGGKIVDTPQKGDIVCFDWDRSGFNSLKGSDHVGIVVDVDEENKKIHVVYGNYHSSKANKDPEKTCVCAPSEYGKCLFCNGNSSIFDIKDSQICAIARPAWEKLD